MNVQGTLTALAEGLIPDYAQQLLWLTTAQGEAIQLPPTGEFSIPATTHLDLRWAHPAGAVLAQWDVTFPPYTLAWDGVVHVGGFVERTHIFEVGDLPLMVVELVGGAYPSTKQSLPTLEDLIAAPFARTTEADPSGDGYWYSLLLSLDSPFADFMHHALINGTALDCTATLGDDEGAWHTMVGLPLLLESVTLLAPGL